MIQIWLLPRREQSVAVTNAVSVQAYSLQVVTGCCAHFGIPVCLHQWNTLGSQCVHGILWRNV